jgi:transposase
MGDEDVEGTRWAEVLAKATAMVALQNAKIENRLEQAKFLQGLGVTQPEAARMLGVSATTLRSLKHQAKKNGGRRGKGK